MSLEQNALSRAESGMRVRKSQIPRLLMMLNLKTLGDRRRVMANAFESRQPPTKVSLFDIQEIYGYLGGYKET